MKVRKYMFYRVVGEAVSDDMLRYDQCFDNAAYPGIVCYPAWAGGAWIPTFDRWLSFGQTLRNISAHEYKIDIHTPPFPDAWFTRVRPYVHIDQKSFDLISVPLRVFLVAPTGTELHKALGEYRQGKRS